MPIYEYQCDSCKGEQEVLQKHDDPAPTCTVTACAKRGTTMRKKVSQSSFELRGGGWARDGYGS